MQYTQLSRRSAGGKIDWEKQYLTFIPVEDAVFSWEQRAVSGHLEYSINGGQTWVTIADGESTPTITAGSKVMWRGDLVPKGSSNGGIGTFSSTGYYHAFGNVQSLLYSDNFYHTTIRGLWTFYRLFYNDTYILSAPLLPATTLNERCYQEMFQGCTSLTTAPLLPATTLAPRCYLSMFCGCRALVFAPELPATTLAPWCYNNMFQGCTSLTTAPELPATTLTDYCYFLMFQRCTQLIYIKCLATDISASNCTLVWLERVASTGTFVKAAGMEDWSTGTNGIPEGWTVVDDNSQL